MEYVEKVRAFAAHMVTQFEANRDRGGYRHAAEPMAAQLKATAMMDLARVRLLGAIVGDLPADCDQKAAIREAAADVANCALICAELANAIVYPRPEA